MKSVKPLGFLAAVALVVGNMVGSGVFLLPASLAPYGAGSLLGWGITLCGALLLAATFARLSSHWPQTGGPYAYVRNAFGETSGFVIAWSYWVSIWCANAAIAVAFAGSIGAIFPGLVATPMRAAACALGALWVCTITNLVGVREAGFMQILTTVLKLVPLLLFGGVAIWYVEPQYMRPFDVGATSLPNVAHATVALTLWAFLGLEAATIPAGSIADAERTIPRATIIGTLLAGIATIVACTAVLGIIPADRLQVSAAPMAEAARVLWGPAAAIAIAAVAAVSCFGALNGWVLLSAQIPLAASRDGLFPVAFGRLNEGGTPTFGVTISTLLASLLVISNYTRSLVQLFTFSILLSTAATLLPYVASSAAWLVRGGRGRVVALLALLYSLYALSGIGYESLLWGGVLVVAGLPLHLWWRRRR